MMDTTFLFFSHDPFAFWVLIVVAEKVKHPMDDIEDDLFKRDEISFFCIGHSHYGADKHFT